MTTRYKGRKTALTRELIDRACALLREGHYVATVQLALGIPDSTWFHWMVKGEKIIEAIDQLYAEADAEGREVSDEEVDLLVNSFPNGSIYLEFATSVKKALADAEMNQLNLILLEARKGTWQAAAWYLERRFRDRWGRPDKPEAGGGQNQDKLKEFLGAVADIAREAALSQKGEGRDGRGEVEHGPEAES